MSPVLALSAIKWVAFVGAGMLSVLGLGLIMVNVVAIARARREGPRSRRPLVGPPRQLSRRSFFGRMMGLGFGIATLDFGALSLALLWPLPIKGFGGKVTLAMKADEIKAQLQATKQPFYFAPGRFYLVPYAQTEGANPYVKAGTTDAGLMALYQRCVHLGCKVPFCITSQWFECPCHGSKYNKAGEYKLGPAPRGLDRFPLKVEDGIVTIDTGTIVTGPPRGTNTTGQEREGPFCVERVGQHPRKKA